MFEGSTWIPCLPLHKLDMLAHTCHPKLLEVATGGIEIQGHPWLCIDFELHVTKEILGPERKNSGAGESKERRGRRKEKGEEEKVGAEVIDYL